MGHHPERRNLRANNCSAKALGSNPTVADGSWRVASQPRGSTVMDRSKRCQSAALSNSCFFSQSPLSRPKSAFIRQLCNCVLVQTTVRRESDDVPQFRDSVGYKKSFEVFKKTFLACNRIDSNRLDREWQRLSVLKSAPRSLRFCGISGKLRLMGSPGRTALAMGASRVGRRCFPSE